MSSILTDHILDKLLCSTCKQYLSCGPTKVYPNGTISCGRCNTDDNANTNSLYDKVSRHLLFSCVNRYEGCNKLLQFKDVTQHEKVCSGNKFSCPLCPIEPLNQLTLLFLLDHYKSAHEHLFLKEPNFFIDPKVMSQNFYLYRDNVNNYVFLIKVWCTQDRVILNVCSPERNRVHLTFILNGILEFPIKKELCNSWEKEEYQYFEAKISDVVTAQNEPILCELFYEIVEDKTSVVVMDLDSIDEAPMERKFRKLPKLYLDKKYFPEHKYKLSHCGSKLICESDSDFVMQLKCDNCDTYFWNITCKQINISGGRISDDVCHRYNVETSYIIVCNRCAPFFNHNNLNSITSSISNLEVYCRYSCGVICSIRDINAHTQVCEFNLEKNKDEFIKSCFKGELFNDDDKFVRGNYIQTFELALGPYPGTPNTKDLTSPERIIYIVTDDEYKCKMYYKCAQGKFLIRVEHEYDPSKYVAIIRWIEYQKIKQIMCLGQYSFNPIKNITGSNIWQNNGYIFKSNTPSFFVTIRKILPQCTVEL